MQTAPDIPDDEISLHDLWQILIRRKVWVLGSPLFAVIAAAIAVTLMQPQWEATALIRIGAVGQRLASHQIIEPAAQVIERMKFKAFGDAVLINLGLPTDDKNPNSTLYRSSLRTKNLRGTELIELKVRGYSQADARRFADATVSYLKKTHNEMAASALLNKRQALERTDREIAQIRALEESLVKLARLKDKPGFMENVVLTDNIAKQGEALRGLEWVKTIYEEQLGPMQTFPTSYIERISLSDKPVSPKKVPVILISGALGLFIGGALAYLDHARSRKGSRETA